MTTNNPRSAGSSGLQNFLTVISFGLLIALLAFSFSLWLTPRYKSTIKLLVINTDANIDTYTASKTANYVTSILKEVIFSDSFISSVFATEPSLIDDLGQNSEARQKAWDRKIKANIQENSGIIILDAYGDDKYQTALMASTIGNTIIRNHGQYDGSSERVNIKMIDSPAIYESWSIKQIAQDTGLGLLAGLLFGFTLIMVFPGHQLFAARPKAKRALPKPQSAGRPDSFSSRPEQPLRQPPENEPVVKPAKTAYEAGDEGDELIDYNQKFSNPWLDEYYEENLPEKTHREN